jgi:hypothetical protein
MNQRKATIPIMLLFDFRLGLFDVTEKRFGAKPDIVLNTAGVIDENDWKTCVNVNLVSSIE